MANELYLPTVNSCYLLSITIVTYLLWHVLLTHYNHCYLHIMVAITCPFEQVLLTHDQQPLHICYRECSFALYWWVFTVITIVTYPLSPLLLTYNNKCYLSVITRHLVNFTYSLLTIVTDMLLTHDNKCHWPVIMISTYWL